MNWLITGGCGFIGTNLVSKIRSIDTKAYIRIVDNLSSGSRQMLNEVCSFKEPTVYYEEEGAVHFFFGDIKDRVYAELLCRNIDVVVHLAANTGVPVSVDMPFEDCESNVLGTLNYLNAARISNVSRFIFASSSAVPGNYDPPYNETLFPRPISPYGASKGAGEAYCHVYNATYGLETVALRFSNVYGKLSTNKKTQLIPKFIMAAKKGEILEIYGDGNQTRDFCYIDDLMSAILKSAVHPNIGGNVFQVATNQETTVNRIKDIVKLEIMRFGIDKVTVKYCDKRPGDPMYNYSDVSKAKDLLEWEYKVGIDEGIKRTVAWFMSHI